MKKKIAVIGAGNGGQAMAGYFAMTDRYDVTLFDFFKNTVDEINEKKEIELKGAVTGKGKIIEASTDMEKVVRDKDLIMVVNPAIYHDKIARAMAPYLHDGQIIFLNPPSVFGAFAFKKSLENAGCYKNVLIGESASLLFAARLVKNGKVHINGKKNRLLVATFPAFDSEKLYGIIREAMPEIYDVKTVIATSFANINALVHPLPTIMNASWAESGSKFLYYWEGIGKTVGNFIAKLDQERVAIGEKLGLILGENLFDFYMCHKNTYNATGSTVEQVLKSVDAYRGIYSSNTVRSRYIYEDIPTGMVAFASVGELLGMPVDKMKLVTKLCEEMLEEDFTHRPESRTVENLGIAGMTAEEIINYAKTGRK